MGADMEVTSIGVPSSEQNDMGDVAENVAEKSKSNKEQAEESKQEKVTKTNTNENENDQKLNTETKEAIQMGTDTEVIGVVSGLQKHAESFCAKGAAATKRTEEVENVTVEKATDAKNSEELVAGTFSVQETAIKDGWESDEMEEEDAMDGKKVNTEKLANDDEKVGDTEDNSNTNSNTGGKAVENGKEIKTSSGQEDSQKQDTDEEMALAEAVAKKNNYQREEE